VNAAAKKIIDGEEISSKEARALSVELISHGFAPLFEDKTSSFDGAKITPKGVTLSWRAGFVSWEAGTHDGLRDGRGQAREYGPGTSRFPLVAIEQAAGLHAGPATLSVVESFPNVDRTGEDQWTFVHKETGQDYAPITWRELARMPIDRDYKAWLQSLPIIA
jgi:hypothetical protein